MRIIYDIEQTDEVKAEIIPESELDQLEKVVSYAHNKVATLIGGTWISVTDERGNKRLIGAVGIYSTSGRTYLRPNFSVRSSAQEKMITAIALRVYAEYIEKNDD